MSLINILRTGYRFAKSVSLIPSAIKVASEESYNPESLRKSHSCRVKDNLFWLFKHHEVNHFYNLYGLDVVGSSDEPYIDYLTFMESRNKMNQVSSPFSQTVLLRDKFLFYKYMKEFGIPVPEVFAVVRCTSVKCGGGSKYDVFDTKLNILNESIIEKEIDYFIKSIGGECGSFVHHIDTYKDFLKLTDEFIQNETYLLQRRVIQNPELSRLNPNAINTLRIATINKNGTPELLTALLRVGTSSTGNVDNWSRGGLAVGIDSTGFLKEYGYYKPEYGTKTSIHPDTNVVFAEFQLPMWKEAVELCCAAHKYFYNIPSIGWDVAITTDGLVLIEGNDNWEISLHQVADHGLKKEWMEAM